MSSPCLSGGGRTYGFDLEIVKSTSTSTRNSQTSSSPSSTLSESSNSPLAISTRKPRTPRKRPNQTYNEAAALLSTAYPGVFPTKHLTNSHKFTRPHDSALLLDDPAELLLPFRVFDNSGFLLHQQQHPIRQKPSFFNEIKAGNSTFFDKSCGGQSSCEVNSHGNSAELCDGYEDDFDAESILDEEIEEGIDSIMGNLSVGGGTADASNQNVGGYNHSVGGWGGMNCWYGNPMGSNFGGKFQFGHGTGMRRGVRALRHVDDGNWWNFPIVDVLQISPRLSNNNSSSSSSSRRRISSMNTNPAAGNPTTKGEARTNPKLKLKLKTSSNSGDNKKKKKLEKPLSELVGENNNNNSSKEDSAPAAAPSQPPLPLDAGLLLKLNYEDVLSAWSDRGSPFSDEIEGNDVSVRSLSLSLSLSLLSLENEFRVK